MNKIAVVISGSLTDRKGMINAALSRIEHLKSIASYDIDVFCFNTYEGFLVRLLRKTKKVKTPPEVAIDNLKIKCIWRKFSLIDYLSVYKFHKKPIVNKDWQRDYIDLFKTYNIISAHSFECGKLAMWINKQYGVPYYVTWHGSDINVSPFVNISRRGETIDVIENAACNFFVSNALLETSNKLTMSKNKLVLYNGVGVGFFKYSEEKRKLLRDLHNIVNTKVVAFVGNLFDVKNPETFVPIFASVKDKFHGNVCFWIIGDGKFKNMIIQDARKHNIEIVFWGNQPVEKMTQFMNCIDVLILPSKNEGLPLVTIEALKCGANVVGSNVGGIPEAIGSENVFDLDGQFLENMSNRIIEMLTTNIEQLLNQEFDWKKTAELENKVYLEKIYNSW